MNVFRTAVALVAIMLLAGGAVLRQSQALARALGTGANWESHGGGVDESGFSRISEINTATIGKLSLAWSLDLAGEVSLEATPLQVNGVIYFTGSYASVYAVDAASGKLLWKYDPKSWQYSPAKFRANMGVNRGCAYAHGRIFSGVQDGRLVALDAKTGKLLWSRDTVAPGDLHTVNGAPLVFKGKVMIGNAGADHGMRGYVTAYDQMTGKQLWRFYITPGDPNEVKGDSAMEKAAATWGRSEYWKTGTGGTVWNGITFDPELNQVYLGTGNAGPYDPRRRDPGGSDDLYIASIVALNADTGKYIWHYQVNPREAWDYKATANMIDAVLTIDGKPRKVLMQAPTNGFFYVIDRKTGQVISAEKTGKVTWADRIDLKTGRPVEAPNIRYENGETIMYPAMIGSHNWQAMTFNPQTGLVYIPFMQLGARYATNFKPGDLAAFGSLPMGGISVTPYVGGPEDGKGALLAWDPIAQRERWRVPLETIWNGGTLTTAGNLVFQGTADGYFTAYDAVEGKVLWRFNAGLGIVAAPISYAIHGRQYVSVLVGYGGESPAVMSQIMNIGWKYGTQPRRLLTFALGGTAVLPPSPPPDLAVHAVDDPSLKLDEAEVQAGQALSINCAACHGPGFRAAGSPGPDLRESHLALSEAAIWAVVHDGALMERGMPRFDSLTRNDVHEIYSYLRATAREALVPNKRSQGH